MMHVNLEMKAGSLIDEHFRYTTNKRVIDMNDPHSEMSNMYVVPAPFESYHWWPKDKDEPIYRGLSACSITKYERLTFGFNKIAIIAKNETIRQQA